MIKYSALLPLYYKESSPNLYQAISSILKQSYKPYELIIIIDKIVNSSHLNIIRKFKNNSIKIFIYRGSKGLGDVLAYGVLKSKTEIIARFDSDDISDQYRIEKQIKFMNRSNVDAVGSSIIEFRHNKYDLNKRRFININNKNEFLRNPLNHMTVVFKKNAILKSGNYKDLTNFEDWYLWLRVIKNGFKISNVIEPLVYARLGKNFYNKRHGFSYMLTELNAIRVFKSEFLIPSKFFYLNLLLRLPIRLLPIKILNIFYFYIRSK